MAILQKAQLIKDAAERESESFAASATAIIDAAFKAMFDEAKAQGMTMPGDDRAARLEEAMAICLISANPWLEANIDLERDRQDLADRAEEIDRKAEKLYAAPRA